MRNVKLCLRICALMTVLICGNVALGAPSGVTMNIQNAEVRNVLTSLAGAAGVNIVIDETVKGKISLNFRDMPPEQALDLVIKTRGLSYQKMADGTIVVADPKTLQAGFATYTVIPLKYGIASEVKKSLVGIVDEQRLKVDDASNSIVYYGDSAEAANVLAAVEKLDLPYRLVSVEAQVVEMKKSASKDIGFDWTFAPAPLQSTADGDENFENKGAIRFGKAPNGKPYEFRYQAQLNALVEKGDGKILAKPRITTISGKEAKILIGDQVPVQSQTIVNGILQTTITYVDTGIKLVYTPVVNADGQVRAHLKTEVSEPSPALGNTNYQIRTRTAETDMLMSDGETVVIGGLMSSNLSNTRTKVPFLGDLPIIGSVFRHDSSDNSETEIVIFLTVKVLKK